MTTTTETEPTTTTDITVMYRAVHRAIRAGAHRLHDAASAPRDAARVGAIAKYWKGYSAELHAHHTTEDDIFFPALVERVPCAADLMARIDADHHRLDELIALVNSEVAAIQEGAGQQSLARALGELAELMDAHLDFEDEDIVPLFPRHFSAAEYQALEKQAIKLIGVGPQATFAIPFVGSAFTEEERREVLPDAPAPVRVILRLFGRRYERLAAQVEGRRS